MKKKKKNTKKTTSKKKKKSTNTALFLKATIFVLVLLILGLGAFLGKIIYENKETKKELHQTKISLKSLEEKVNNLQKELKKEKQKIITYSEIKDYEEVLKKQKTTPKKQTQPKSPQKQPKVKTVHFKKPKLVIIIDDVAFANQIRAIKSLPFKITPSFFPPNRYHPNTAKYATYFKDYMIHVPMEAIHWNKPEINTLKTTSSYVDIYRRISELKAQFPNAMFINNHTGSKFTSDIESMNKLFKVLRLQNLGFVDSKTTPYSKAKLANNTYHIPLFSRDIFLDNEENISYIHNQLKKAVRIAMKKGYAIAIGHPHKITFEALKSARGILRNVDVITINQLYKLQHAKN
jgi:polysaccharide deacetylase 2 family uncharacterized protein YibQ